MPSNLLLLTCGVLLLTVNVALSLLLLRKLTRVDRRTWPWAAERDQAFANLYQQTEALTALYAELQPSRGLPGTRGWAASPDFLLHIARAARDLRPSVVVECSCGTSTLVLARACQLNGVGHVYSLEHDKQFAQITRDHLRRHGVDAWATVLNAPLAMSSMTNTSWYSTEKLPEQPIDLLVIDGPPAQTAELARHPAGPHLFERLSQGAQVYLDDMIRPAEQQTVQRWLEEFPGMRRADLPAEKGLCVLTVTAQTARG